MTIDVKNAVWHVYSRTLRCAYVYKEHKQDFYFTTNPIKFTQITVEQRNGLYGIRGTETIYNWYLNGQAPPLFGGQLHHNLSDARPETFAICFLRAVIQEP